MTNIITTTTQPLFHVVRREVPDDGPTVTHGVDREDWGYALYRRVADPHYKYGVLIALLWDKTEADLTCAALNGARRFLASISGEPCQ